MAHERAEAVSEPSILLVEADEVEGPAVNDRESASPIDQLLALTDDGWEIDEQRKTLQKVAAPKPLAEKTAHKSEIGTPAIPIPTPFELATTWMPALAPPNAQPAANASAQPAPSETPPPPVSKPPSLPPRAGTSSAGKVPPPLPPLPLTVRKASVPPASTSRVDPARPSALPPPPEGLDPQLLVELLQARLMTLQRSDDRIGLGRTYIEMAIAHEMLFADDTKAAFFAEASLKSIPDLAPAHTILRRRKHSRQQLAAMLGHLEHEIATSVSSPASVELLAEKARLLDASGDKSEEARAVWEQAAARAPNHAAILKGLEGALWPKAFAGDSAAAEELVDHLAKMGDSYASQPSLSAWLHVERARLLEQMLHRIDSSRTALERALELDPRVGPVRHAVMRHVSTNSDWDALARLLDDEGTIETSPIRAARLELDAACIAGIRLGNNSWAISLLERAAARAPTHPLIDRRVLDELIRLYERAGEWPKAARARRSRLSFFREPRVVAHELRILSTINAQIGDLEMAIADVQRALTYDPADGTLLETLDRLLLSLGKHEARAAVWVTEAARTDDPTKRARAYGRAAAILETALARPDDAIRQLRAGWVGAPGDSEVFDALSRLLTPTVEENHDREVRTFLDVFSQAAEHARDPERRIAYLETAAVLWEQLQDFARATRTYEEILRLDPDRRTAILGLARAAGRLGDARAVARALLEEARLAEDGVTNLGLRTRAASTLSAVDPARAVAIVEQVIEADAHHPAARALETRLHEEAGRWELVARSLDARIEMANDKDKVGLYLALAHVQHSRLNKTSAALESLHRARAIDPIDPVVPEQITNVLEALGDDKGLAEALEKLGTAPQEKQATADGPDKTADERVLYLLRAAEIFEMGLGDDVAATRLYERAYAIVPDNDLVSERLSRVLLRQAKLSDPLQTRGEREKASLDHLIKLLSARLDSPGRTETAPPIQFQLAMTYVHAGTEPERAATLLEALLSKDPRHVPAMRTLEYLRRRTDDWAGLARSLAREGDHLTDVRARIGAFWALSFCEEWRLPVGDSLATYRRILDLDPTDAGALEATVRRELPNARRGDPRSRKAVLGALRPLVSLAPDEATRIATQLRLGFLLEIAATEGGEHTEALGHEALERYQDALRLDSLSVTAATGVARLANRLQNTPSAFLAACALAELATDAQVRARYLFEAAELLLSEDSDSIGTRDQRRTRAADLFEKSLESFPDYVEAAARLASVLLDARAPERLVQVFRSALKRAKTTEAIVTIGSELARVARDELRDISTAIDAMRRIREAAPEHVTSLLMLAELCIAQRSWHEAVEALEAVVTHAKESQPKLTALFALASVYEKVLGKPDQVERVLREALKLDPSNSRALKALIRKLSPEPSTRPDLPEERRLEIESLVHRLVDTENDAEHKSELLLELAQIRAELGDSKGVKHALIEAVGYSRNNAKAFTLLERFFNSKEGRDHIGYARALVAVIGLGQQLGIVDPNWFATLGMVEIHSLGRMRDGIQHLQRAVQMAPDMHEARLELSAAYVRANAYEEASHSLLGMVVPSPRPLLSVKDPARGLELLEQSLTAEHRSEEAIVVTELRAIAGSADDARVAWLRSRRLHPIDREQPATVDRATLISHVATPQTRHILLDIAQAISGLEAKTARTDLSELRLTSRDRIHARSGHPTRTVLDRVARQLNVPEFEFALSPHTQRVRVVIQDVPWVVAPSSLANAEEPAQLVAFARALVRIALGVPWLEELSGPHIEAMLIAAARIVAPRYAAEDIDLITGKLVAQHEAVLTRTLGRKHRKQLEELVPKLSSTTHRPMPIDAFIQALTQTELRGAFVIAGDLLTTLDDIRTTDHALGRALDRPGIDALGLVLEHPLAGDIARFALSPEATAVRRRLRSIWTK